MGHSLARGSMLWCLALSAFAILGCESRVSLGRRCDVDSECDFGLVCRAGRCRVECYEARDCVAPLECVLGPNGGGCRVPEDEGCTSGTIDCGEGLACIDGRCAQPCTENSQCAAAQTCADDTLCARPPLVPGTCDVLSGAGCTSGERCTFEGTCESVGVMASEVQDALHGACDAERPCREGFDCRLRRCVRLCKFDEETGEVITSCAGGSRCLRYDESGSNAPVPFGYCTQPCDLADATGTCPAGMGCGADFLSGDLQVSCERAFVGDCEEDPTQDGCPFQACGPSTRCAVGTDCLETLSRGDVPAICLPFCDESGTCPQGSVCARGDFSLEYIIGDATYERGICLPTCDVDVGICNAPDESVGCDAANPFSGNTALCTQRCASDTDCFALFRCDVPSGQCTPRNDF